MILSGSVALHLQVGFVAGFDRYLQLFRTAGSCPVLFKRLARLDFGDQCCLLLIRTDVNLCLVSFDQFMRC